MINRIKIFSRDHPVGFQRTGYILVIFLEKKKCLLLYRETLQHLGHCSKRGGFQRKDHFSPRIISTLSQGRAEERLLVDLEPVGPDWVVGRAKLTLWFSFFSFRMQFPSMALSSEAIPSMMPWSSFSGCWIVCMKTWRARPEHQDPRRLVTLRNTLYNFLFSSNYLLSSSKLILEIQILRFPWILAPVYKMLFPAPFSQLCLLQTMHFLPLQYFHPL